MQSQAELRGHPVHPMLVSIPIGLFGASLISDITYAAAGNPFFYDMAQWTMGLGVLAAIGAAIPGLIDYYGVASRHTRTARTAFTHGALNLAIVAMYAVDWILHMAGAQDGPMLAILVGLNVLAFAGLMASGWLGGRLVYMLGMGVREPEVRVTMMDEERIKSQQHL